MGIDILGIDIMGVDISGVNILAPSYKGLTVQVWWGNLIALYVKLLLLHKLYQCHTLIAMMF